MQQEGCIVHVAYFLFRKVVRLHGILELLLVTGTLIFQVTFEKYCEVNWVPNYSFQLHVSLTLMGKLNWLIEH